MASWKARRYRVEWQAMFVLNSGRVQDPKVRAVLVEMLRVLAKDDNPLSLEAVRVVSEEIHRSGENPLTGEELGGGSMLTTDQVMARLACGRSTLARIVQRGELASVKVGKRRLYKADSVEEYLQRRLMGYVTADGPAARDGV